MTGEPRVADVVARTLARTGIRRAFGVPGGEVLTLVDALARAGIDPILARQESAAAAMATATATLGTTPGLAFTTIGPGLISAVNGVANAFQERTALILLSGVVERAIRGRFTHQVVDHAAILRPIVKASFEVEATARRRWSSERCA
ncbi:thiamine pyrophosphate-binding protein [Roseomonas sp. CCTCC AB2023176]|uniref:thiamine pyrophosphate-binding protein n=1 Tax=Roseomonas sp. CCTCC AB2023176 TaxID=3342640 RepID=UPI0035DA3959